VWIATQTSLLRLDPETEKIKKYDQKDGIPSNQINALIEDLQGNLWISTSGGLSRLNKEDPEDNWNFVNFDTRDGLPSSSSGKAIWISSDGEIVVGSNDGITSFYPGESNEVKPDIIIQDIKISDVSLKTDSAVVKPGKSIPNLDKLYLSYKQNNISFEFAALHFSRPAKNKIIYKLEGFNDNWISTDRNFASYTNLSPGEYIFRVKGSNGDGIWNEEGKSLRIIISPPWWKTAWAYISYGILFLLIVFGIDRFQRKRILEKQRSIAKDKELVQAREIEKAYHELKITQTQLIQSEKMASLGELTAGIAHEIQNPLNFVNNFSEVNKELISEMNDEIAVGNWQLAKEISLDIEQNLEKINHHGKRADAIVKGMLQHSRSSNGIKEPTDINVLVDEYLRLAYHGLRAKDKDFNAAMKTDFDETIGKIDIIPQDIGRVILNLITNAFYAVDEKKKLAPPTPQGGIESLQNQYEPTVTVSTETVIPPPTSGGQRGVKISIKDNGPGIPQKVLDKIFQPFFTTKPTGQGTGLGLSLAYDIVQAHGGELRVETTEGESTSFIVYLPV
jgi:signal transduction histidine kinase